MAILNRSRADRWVASGDRARDAKDWPAAARAYRNALTLRPRLVHIWVQYGHALKESGFLVDAELAYRQALARDRVIGDSYLQLGHVLKKQGRLAEALDAYRHAYIADPDLDPAKTELRSHDIDYTQLVPLPKRFF